MLLFLTIFLSWLASSFVEYCLHRFLLHRSYEQSHIQIHHKIFHGIKSYEFKEVNAADIISSKKDILLSVLLTLPVAIFIFIENISFGILFILTSTLYSLWAEYVHLHFHKSSDIFLMKFKFFKRLKEHHRIHHYAYNTNYGIGSTIWDVIFSTKKK